MIDLRPAPIARRALALHLGIGEEAICGIDRLEEDWGIDPFDLLVVASRIAQIANVDIALSDLGDVVTVADLEAVVQKQRQARSFWW